jgi:hypothetical protein
MPDFKRRLLRGLTRRLVVFMLLIEVQAPLYENFAG